MDLEKIRQQIDEIDDRILALFLKRMEIVKEVAEYKQENNMEVYQADREIKILERLMSKVSPQQKPSVKLLYTTIMDMSKAIQYNILYGDNDALERIKSPNLLDISALQGESVACQGIKGAYSHIASEKIFNNPNINFVENFEDVFNMVKSGECKYGVLPIENSTAGSVEQVYDLVAKHNLYICGGTKLNISHCLVAKKGNGIKNIKKVFSHPQALAQCSELIDKIGAEKIEMPNTAVAAKYVAESDDNSYGAIASELTAKIYGLQILKSNIQNAPLNMTRFIVISKDFIITPDADKISLCLKIPHKTGSLYKILTQFATRDLNLTKIESRPLPNTDFEFLFYFDFCGNIASRNIIDLFNILNNELEYIVFLGNYHEKV